MRHKYRTSQVDHVHYDLSLSDEERFWSCVQVTDSCWWWQGPLNAEGYGVFSLKGKGLRAHRVSWFLTRHYLPKGLFVCHTCDGDIGDITYRRCVRQHHLFLGTTKENTVDMFVKGRNCTGFPGRQLG